MAKQLSSLFAAYIPIDRLQAMSRGQDLPDRTLGAVLFADISGFTPLTAALLKELGLKRGPEELTYHLNRVYDALIAEVHRYQGSPVSFAGDAITCWFNGDDGLRSIACGLAMQVAMQQFSAIKTSAGAEVSLGMKVAIAVGPARRFVVGDPTIQIIDTLAGTTLDRMARGEHQANKGEVVVAPEVIAGLGDKLIIADFREDHNTGERFAVVAGLVEAVAATPWPELILPNSEAKTTARKKRAKQMGLTAEKMRPWLLPPVYERLKSSRGQFLAEIRPAVALFLRFGGVDYDSDDLAGQKLDAYLQWVQAILAKYESYLLQLNIGDKGCYLCVGFGAPIAHDDDPARAVAAALELQAPPPKLSFIGPVQIGINQGRVWAGAYGGSTRGIYGIMGDEVNMAARLMQRAEPGQIIAGRRVADAVADNFRLEYLGPIKVKGKEEPISASLVLGRQRQAARKPVSTFPNSLVGREDELVQLAQVLALADGGEGQLLRVQGVAGIGKSHLITEFAGRALRQGWRVVLGACESTGLEIPYHPWRQIFRALFVLLDKPVEGEDQTTLTARQIEQATLILTELNPDWLVRLPLLGDLLNLPVPDNPTTAAFDPHLRQEALFALAVELIQRWAQAQPLLILVEDAHWLDEASRELTLALARVVSQAQVILAVTHRPPLDETGPILPELNRLSNYHLVDLGDLSPTGVEVVVANRLQGQPSALLLSLVQLQARGNPFFVEELLDTLREYDHLSLRTDGIWDLSKQIITALQAAQCLTRDESGQLILDPHASLSAADLGLPDSIRGLVLARLDRLLEDHKLTLKVASVIGRIFQFQLLARAHPVETDEERLLNQVAEIEAREFARLETPLPQLAHIFKHNITRDVAYETLLEQQQRDLHRAVAEAMESLLSDAVEQLAYHYSRAKVRDKTLHYLDKAARKAQHEFANETALNYYQQALALEERWTWRMGQIEVLHLLGRREEERTALERMEEMLNRGAEEQGSEGEIASARLPPRAPAAFELAYLWGQYYEAISDYPQAQAAVERALAASRVNGDRLAEARCLAQLGLIARQPGDYEAAKRWYQQALALFDSKPVYPNEEAQVLTYALNGLGTTLRQQGDFEQAKTYYRRALTLSRQRSNRPAEAEALNSLGVTAYYQRNLAEAATYFQQALTIRQAIGDRTGESKSLYSLAMSALHLGNYSQTHEYLTGVLAILQATGNRWDEVNAWNSLGIMHQELGNLSVAQTCLERGLRLAQEIGDEAGQAYIMDNLGLVAYDSADFVSAEKQFAAGLALAQKHDDKQLISNFFSHLSMTSQQVDKFEQAIAQAETALTLRQQLGMRLSTSDNLATLAAVYLATSDLVKALNYAEQALVILAECGGEGPEFPQRDYFGCYQVFVAAGQAERAQMVLQSAYDLVMLRADKIVDSALRQSFLERVAVNREIVATYFDDASWLSSTEG